QLHAFVRHARAERDRRLDVGRAGAAVGAAVDANASHGIRDSGFGIRKGKGAGSTAPREDRDGPGFCESRIPNPGRQFALWIARLSTAMAASWMTSDRLGCAWQMRARSSAEPLNSIVSTPSWTSSETLAP